jgi:cell filamentation protein, protein adenylyltransferase
LGRLVGAGRQLPDPHIFVRPYVTREALASSRIEGTVASLPDVLQAEATPETPATGDIREVLNYMAAMDQGLSHLPELPLVHRVVTDIHAVLLSDVRVRSRAPGQFRREPVWIGSPTSDSPEASVYVPPFPAEMLEAWRDWEEFANTEPRLPKLVQCALLHYQFETIHPFLDGNGRIGRLLIVLFLLHRAFLPAPLLYISAYLEEFRRDYYERLQGVRERGEMQEWLQFFFSAVAVQATGAPFAVSTTFSHRSSLPPSGRSTCTLDRRHGIRGAVPMVVRVRGRSPRRETCCRCFALAARRSV